MKFVGIDPGKLGGISVIDYSQKKRKVTSIGMPKTERDLWNFFLCNFSDNEEKYGLIEKVHSFPSQGVKSMFTFGYNYGLIRMCLIAANIPFQEITPQKWIKFYNLPSSSSMNKTHWKNLLKQKAQNLFPHVKITLQNADSLLIANYNLKTYER